MSILSLKQIYKIKIFKPLKLQIKKNNQSSCNNIQRERESISLSLKQI
ncbi:hypothetical protein BFO_0059 [Tannerella forsythia 92A2]|uniref:Uncharacterized protein n=1 Tax=Tannerella forsythia (strain ATCC 43037 / JCM 10827 / CCUG 21028 A / KCTC 5666 / FDC 338) TaxID=203275 RepID=G8UQJ5_TANFA|nr:hypothetical protein BFO_0059 [Tannerella forsythia 92A2]